MTASNAKVPVSAAFDAADIRRLDEVASLEGRSRADVMRIAIKQYLDREGIVDPLAPPASKGVSDATRVAVRGRRTGR